MTLPMDRLASGYGGSRLAPAGTDPDNPGASGLLHHEWGVILAGGDGTRLQSLTRTLTGDERPKQFCAILSDATLLEETQRRAALALATERTLVVVNRRHEPYYAALLSDMPARQIVAQPRNVGTAPAILYSVLKIAAADPHAIVAVFPSDHYISDNTTFMAHVRRALDTAHVRPELVLLLGIEPDSPEVAYGWIERAAALHGHAHVYGVRRFWEKPNHDLATLLYRHGCLWNSFVMVASVRALRDLIACATPTLYRAFAGLSPLLGTEAEAERMRQLYRRLTETNFSHQVLALVPERLAVLPVTGLRWSDLGDPQRVRAALHLAGVRPRWVAQD